MRSTIYVWLGCLCACFLISANAFGNSAPSFVGGALQSINGCLNATRSINSILAISDADTGQTETWSLLVAPVHGTVTASYSALSTGGTISPSGTTYTPVSGYLGADQFTVRVTDGIASDTITIYVTVHTLPSVDTVTGGGAYCAGGTGVHVGLNGSATGVTYILYNGGTASGSVPGTGSALDFGLQTAAGTYIVVGTTVSTGCSATMDSNAIVTVIPVLAPTVSISTSAGDSVCTGTAVTFTANPVNGGSTPAYQWKVNGTNVGIDSVHYHYTPTNGDIIKVVLHSNATCAFPDSAVGTFTMTVLNKVTPSVTITSDNADTVCMGAGVTYTAHPTYGGSGPTYSWMRNTTTSGGGATYLVAPHDKDSIYVVMTSNYICLLTPTAVSPAIIAHIDTPAIPPVYIDAYPARMTYPGQYDTIVAVVPGAEGTLTYQWQINGADIPGATSDTFISNAFNYYGNDSVSCVVVANGRCHVTVFGWIFTMSNVGVKDIAGALDVSAFPNPNNGKFTIKGTTGMPGETVAVSLVDMLGRNVYHDNFIAAQCIINTTLSATLTPGVYMLQVNAGTEQKVFSVVVE